MADRVRTSNIEDYIKGKILDYAMDNSESNSRVFYYGIVINNNDPKNANRIQVRIPLLDDHYYLNRTKTDGDKVLPWCNPISRNMLSTPENNSIVGIALFDPATPYWGRMFIDGFTDLNEKNIFDSSRLTPEINTYNNWNNVENVHNVIMKNRPKNDNDYNSSTNVNYPVGIKGKGNNKILLDDTSVYIVQNENVSGKQSMLKFTDSVNLTAANVLELLSSTGNRTHYHPVFHKPLYDQLSLMNNMIKSIVTMLNGTPALQANGSPCVPSPDAVNLITNLAEMYNGFNQMKIDGNGASAKIFIN